MVGLPTAYALQALLESGIPKDDPPVLAAVQWLVNHQAQVAGDWQRRVKVNVEPGGWCVGVAAEQYPDVDCTVTVLQALLPVRYLCKASFQKAVNWVLALEDRDGGWAAWDRNNRRGLFFSLEVVIARARVNLKDPQIQQAIEWLKSIQNPDGGWGESKESYKTSHFEPGPSEPLITVFVLEGLITADGPCSQAVGRGLSYLVKVQEGDGSWQDRLWSGVTIPGMSYCKYNLVPTCSAVIAIFRKWGSYEKVYQPTDRPHRF
jgi:squalene-hopene/tetraprenyl-beta-curcumene cyclase